MDTIRFGTSGWRGILAKDFTYRNIAVVVQGICDYLKDMGTTANGIYIGHDSRFLGEQLAELARTVATANNIKVLYSTGETPAPVISWVVRSQHLDGGINFTASHNQPEYNGIKFTPSWGGPALPETTSKIEETVQTLLRSGRDYHLVSGKPALCTPIDPRPEYFHHLKGLINFETITRSGLSVLCDPLWGAGRTYLSPLLAQEGIKVKTLHNYRDPYFGGRAPEPSAANLYEMVEELRESDEHSLGLALDCDADRFGVLDLDGEWIQPNYLLAMILDYLLETRPRPAGLGVARTVATTHLLDRIAEAAGIPLFETPVGFKYIGDLINKDQILLGGEESGGISIRDHLPEKDGLLGCLLTLEMVCQRGHGLKKLLGELYATYGSVRCRRLDVSITPTILANVRERLRNLPNSLGSRKVLEVRSLDGIKIQLEGPAWILFREAGTEPLVRVYLEAASDEELDLLESQARSLLLA
ncbi:MAG: hypothetical protein A2284_08180 [Deltaproteobacteria bacterium RIFOXYA12_FULL_61_11]|nr:MAG: hypothetical protein A2284_08180 [Deltaproteobacteria bacterium RIFOXYA12_FULL_61_11]